MNSTQLTILGALAAYFILMIYIGMRQSRKQNHEGFIIGGRNVGYIPTLGSLASGFRDGMGLVWWVGAAYTAGYADMWLFVGVALGGVVMALIGPRVRTMAAENNYVTVSEMVRDCVGPRTEKLSALISAFMALLFMGIQLYVSGNIFAMVLDVPTWIGVTSIAVIVAFYLFAGGYGSVIWTDAVQFFLILSLLSIPFIVPIDVSAASNLGTLFNNPLNVNLGLGILGFLFIIALPDSWQRIFSAKSGKVIRVCYPLAGVMLIAMTVSLLFLGYGLKIALPEGIDKGQVVFEMFSAAVYSPAVLAYIAVIMVAITMSTLDTYTYVFTSSVLKNFAPRRITENRDTYVRLSRILMVLALIIVSYLAMSISDVIQYLFDIVSLIFTLGPVYVLAALGKLKRTPGMDVAISLSILAGVAVYVYLFMGGMFTNLLLTGLPPLVSLIGCFISLALVSKKA